MKQVRRINGGTYGRVNFVHAETRIQIRQGRDRWTYPGRRERRAGANVRRIVGVENLELLRTLM